MLTSEKIDFGKKNITRNTEAYVTICLSMCQLSVYVLNDLPTLPSMYELFYQCTLLIQLGKARQSNTKAKSSSGNLPKRIANIISQ